MARHQIDDRPLSEPMLTRFTDAYKGDDLKNGSNCTNHDRFEHLSTYRKVSYIRRTLVGNKIVDHSDVVGASPVGAAPTTSSFST